MTRKLVLRQIIIPLQISLVQTTSYCNCFERVYVQVTVIHKYQLSQNSKGYEGQTNQNKCFDGERVTSCQIDICLSSKNYTWRNTINCINSIDDKNNNCINNKTY